MAPQLLDEEVGGKKKTQKTVVEAAATVPDSARSHLIHN